MSDDDADSGAPVSGNVSAYFADGLVEAVLDELSIADLCTDVGRAGISAASELSEDEISARTAAYEEAMREAQERLVVSQDAEHLHISALLEVDPAKRIELIKKALMSSRNDAFLAWDAVHICTRVPDKGTCPVQEWEDQLLALDGQNSEAWIRVAANRLHRDDGEGALRAMQRAATSPVSRVYWTETIEAAVRSFAAAGDFSFLERASYGFGIAAANNPRYSDYTKMCREEGAKNQEWAYACLAYGELVELQGKTILGQAIARTIQKIALESLEDDERLATLAARKEKVRQGLDDLLRVSGGSRLETIGLSNPTIFYGFLTVMSNDGEMAAQVYLQNETERWLHQRQDLECTP
ncbi:MAG: hypothetical protein ACE5OQ_13010 [Woeseia sp.]